jgi:hypothetical protein
MVGSAQQRGCSSLCLLQQDAPGRYSWHDLLRLYAAQHATIEDSEADRAAAVERLLWWYEKTADAAARALYPQRLRLAHAVCAS